MYVTSARPKKAYNVEVRSGRLGQLSQKENEVDRLVDLRQTKLDFSALSDGEEVSTHIIVFRESHLKTYKLTVCRPSSARCTVQSGRLERIFFWSR